jgi:hypothetical protein
MADLPFACGHRSRGRQHRGLRVAAAYFGVPTVGDVGAEYLQPALGHLPAHEMPNPDTSLGRAIFPAPHHRQEHRLRVAPPRMGSGTARPRGPGRSGKALPSSALRRPAAGSPRPGTGTPPERRAARRVVLAPRRWLCTRRVHPQASPGGLSAGLSPVSAARAAETGDERFSRVTYRALRTGLRCRPGSGGHPITSRACDTPGKPPYCETSP